MIDGALLAYLRRALGRPGLAYAEPPARLRGGFDTTIYAFRLAGAPDPFAGPLVLRVYRDEWGAEQARFEGAVHRAISARGYPTPRVLASGDAASELARAFLLLERAPGQPLLRALFSRRAPRVPALLADAQVRLHALDPAPIEAELAAAGIDVERLRPGHDLLALEREIERLALDDLRAAFARLTAKRRPPADSVLCHGDFHPLNVLFDGAEVSGVIDWTRLRIAEPAYDVGATAALLGQGPVELPALLGPLVRAVRRVLVRDYERAYRRHRPLSEETVRYYEALRCVEFLVEAGEHRRAAAGEIPTPSKPTAFGAPRVVDGIVARLRALTGAAVSVP